VISFLNIMSARKLFRFVSLGIIALVPATLAQTSGVSAKQSVCPFGSRVVVDPGHHPATVLANSSVSCRVHYEDGAYADAWVHGFMVKPADADGKAAAAAKNPPPPGRYTCGVFLNGRFVFTQYITLSGGSYESSIAGSGKFHYDSANNRLLFDSGKFQPLFASYERLPAYPMFRLSAREDTRESDYTRSWRSEVCSGKY
jgi:hypothetical protein